MKIRLTFLFLLVMLGCILPLQAQEIPAAQTATPGGLVYGMEAEILFPAAIRFTLAVTSTADELAFAILTIRPQGQQPITIPVSIAESATLRAPFTEVVYLWNIPAANPLLMFTDVVYEWQITLNNDQIVTAENVFQFTDPRLVWTSDTAQDSNITFTLPAEDFNVPLGLLRTELQATYDLMFTSTERQPFFHIMLYPTNVVPGCDNGIAVGLLSGTEVPCTAAQAEAIYDASGIDVLQVVSVGTEAELRISLANLFVDSFYEAVWNNSDVPLWFRRGLALFYLPINKLNLLEPAQRAARSNGLFTLAEMTSVPSEDADLWLAQSYGMVLYIARQAGVDGLFTLANNPGTSFATAYQSTMGQPVANLISGWQRWLFTTGANDAYAYFPHLPTTPTPTHTPTATLPRPTATSTSTNTPTSTSTVTNTGLPQRILPTLTPTRRPTQGAPSVTPRPASSLPTPTPIPTTPVATPGQAAGLAALAFILLLLAGLSGLYLWLTSRRS